ncbi:hypothetical protein ACOSP7_009000 [Xanthoceras sorbifolium]
MAVNSTHTRVSCISSDILCVAWWRIWFLRNQCTHSVATHQPADVGLVLLPGIAPVL